MLRIVRYVAGTLLSWSCIMSDICDWRVDTHIMCF